MILIWSDSDNNIAYLYHLFEFLNLMLDGKNNKSLQKEIYDFFIKNKDTELFFKKLNSIIKKQISRNQDPNINVTNLEESNQLLCEILRFMQLLCEGHNFDLQNYLRNQTNSKNNYDMVTLTGTLLASYKIRKSTYDIVLQCFETLTEFIEVILNNLYNLKNF